MRSFIKTVSRMRLFMFSRLIETRLAPPLWLRVNDISMQVVLSESIACMNDG